MFTFELAFVPYTRTKREDRLCSTCGVLGDEAHFIYYCSNVERGNLTDIPDLCDLSSYEKLQILLMKLKEYL